jgi:hypothetical protein
METPNMKSQLTCYNCEKVISKQEMVPVQVRQNAVKPYCTQCANELKTISKKNTRARSPVNWFRSYAIVPFTIATVAIIIITLLWQFGVLFQG